MNDQMIVIMGVAVAFNFIVIIIKLQMGRIVDGFTDAGILFLVGTVLSGSFAGLMVGTVASAIASVYLWFMPPKFTVFNKKNKEFDNGELTEGFNNVNQTIIKNMTKKTRRIR